LCESNTRKLVIKLRSADLFMTMSEIAQKVGISRQRVHQILQKEGLSTKHKTKKCRYKCPVCGTISTWKFCSVECKRKWQLIPIICSRCGNLFTRNKYQFLNNYRHHGNALFCSKHCAGKWLAEQYQFMHSSQSRGKLSK
jgi:predicted transcriptional regulator